MLDAFGFVSTASAEAPSHLYRAATPRDYAGVQTLEHLHVAKVIMLVSAPIEAAWDLRQWGFEVACLRFDVQRVSARGIISIANRIHADLHAGATMVVCCRHGRLRTGLVIGAWRLIFDGWSMDDVERERATFGAGWERASDEQAVSALLEEIDGTPPSERWGQFADIRQRSMTERIHHGVTV